MSDFKPDIIVQEVLDRVYSRAEQGMETYGVSMERDDLTVTQWIDHAIEEALDFAVYMTRVKSDLKTIIGGGQ